MQNCRINGSGCKPHMQPQSCGLTMHILARSEQAAREALLALQTTRKQVSHLHRWFPVSSQELCRKLTWRDTRYSPGIVGTEPAAKLLSSFQSGYAAGVQVTVSVKLKSDKNLKAVEYSGGIQQVGAFRSKSAYLGI